MTSIYYVEDIDSLRFALSIVDEYNVSRFQPHFPGYPVFCFVAYIFYSISQSLAFSFSLIGGVSTFLIIYFSLNIMKFKINSKNGLLCILIIFLNPMIWNLSNRYMADLMGLSIAIASIYYIVYSKKTYGNYIGFFLAGLLLGVRLSYFPLILVPILIFLIKKEKLISSLSYLVLGISIWLIPFIISQGFENLLFIGFKHSIGHFTDYGGTIITEQNLLERLIFLVHTIWSDGLGAYWIGRAEVTLVIGIIILIITVKSIVHSTFKIDSKLKVLILCSIVYLIWIFFFQNLIYKSRHVLPIVYAMLLFISLSLKYEKFFYSYYVLIISLIILNYNLISGHKNGTAIYHLSNNLKIKKTDFIISNPLINYYLKSHGIQSNYIDIEQFNIKSFKEQFTFNKTAKVIGNYSELFENNYAIVIDSIYYHNPYMNRMWSNIPIYSINQ